jgi:hypothetical protein
MKKYYFRLRVLLMTFALGLVSVFVFNKSLNYLYEVPINSPKVQAAKIIVISPKYSKEIPKIGGIIACNRREISIKELKEINSKHK